MRVLFMTTTRTCHHKQVVRTYKTQVRTVPMELVDRNSPGLGSDGRSSMRSRSRRFAAAAVAPFAVT